MRPSVRFGDTVILMMTLLLLSGCISDNELDFPDDRSDEITRSLEVFTLVNLYDQFPENACFSIVYPIELAYNTGIIVQVDSRSGLFEAVKSQSNTFYISGLILPILVDKGGVLSSVENSADLRKLLVVCEIPELSSQLRDFEGQCFEFKYPITLIEDNTDVLIENESAYEDYKKVKGNDFSPRFRFPLNVDLFEADETVDVSDYYQLLQIINSCEPCPEAEIHINPEFNGTYTFSARYHRNDLPVTYKWYINDDLIGDGSLSNRDSLNLELAEGSYKICLKSFNPDCMEGSVVCRSLKVSRPCIDLFFNKEQSSVNPKLYHFLADFELQNDITYEWVVYKGGVFVTSEEEIPGEGDNKFTYEFTPGFYTVCLEKENLNAECQLAKYCIELAIE